MGDAHMSNRAESIARSFTLKGIRGQITFHRRSLYELDQLDDLHGERGKVARDFGRVRHIRDLKNCERAFQIKVGKDSD